MISGYVLVVGEAYKDSSGNLLNGTISFQPVRTDGVKASYRAGQSTPQPAAWNAGTAYAPGVAAAYADGSSTAAYVSLVDGNLNHPPSTNGAVDLIHWLPVPAGCFGPGQVSSEPVSASVLDGAFAVILPDTSTTVPQNVGFAITISDAVTDKCSLGGGYNCFQPTTGASLPGSANADGVVSFDSYNPNLAPQVTVQTGPPGLAGTIDSATAVALETGASPTVTLGGTPSVRTLAFGIPTGPPGPQGPPGANSQVGTISGTFARQAYTGDGSTTVFTLPLAGVELLYLNGLLLTSPVDYSKSGTSITTTFTMTAADRLTAVVFPAS